MTRQLPIFVLNLDRATDRWAAVSSRLTALGLTFERIRAHDRRNPAAEALWAAFGGGRLARDYPATLGDVCCSQTHRDLWHRIATLTDSAAIVLEDDARPAPVFAAYARADLGALLRAHGIGALKLEHWPGGERSRRFPMGRRLGALDFAEGAGLYRQEAGFLGTCAYAITREAAGRLLAAHDRLNVPVDHYMFSRSAGLGFPILRPAFVAPAPVLHDFPTLGSDILNDRIAGGIATHRPGWRRRLREAVLRRQLAREMRRGVVDRVEMHWAGEPEGARDVGPDAPAPETPAISAMAVSRKDPR